MSNKGKIKLDYRDNLQGASFAFNGMNFMVDPADLPIEDGQCVDICNCDIDSFANVSRRDGYTRITSGDIGSAWANQNGIYCAYNNQVCKIEGVNIIPFTNSPTVRTPLEFKQVNDVVIYSDGLVMGMIDSSNNLFVFSKEVEFG